MKTVLLKPAYGRSYATAEECKKDWTDGKDFQIMLGDWQGSYCSIRDYVAGESITIRYSRTDLRMPTVTV